MDDLIAKVLAGEASREEIDRLEGWMNEARENREYFDSTKTIFARIEMAKHRYTVDTGKAWEKLNARISEEQGPSEAKVIPLFRRTALRVAASLLLIAALAILVNSVFNNQEPVPVVLAAQQKVVEQKLPDGSKVTLNKNTEIAYVVSNKQVREVKLKGEAYFEVVHNEELPFEIVVDDIIIQDIGTAFNVKALPGSNVVEVLVQEGEVHFFTTSNEGIHLVKGEKAVYDKTSKTFTKIEPKPAENTLTYKSKVFYFKGTPLRDVVRQLNEIYESRVELGNPALGDSLLSTSFDNMQLEDIIDIIAETHDLQAEKKGDKIVLKPEPSAE